MDNKVVIISTIVLSGAGLFVYWLWKSRKEGYGAMRNIKQIPFNDCRRICETYHKKCVSDFALADPSFCDRKLEACTAECYYTPYQRLPG